ncbi:MAG: uracil-DNA glycosylase [Bacillota bacterium]|jgi:uracil-DNA glycosylase family 4|nr:uracil-DNA glycosylase [Candidatus Fermentithermobacillaceae bacterium]
MLSDGVKIEQRSLFDSLSDLRVPQGQASLFPPAEEKAGKAVEVPKPSRDNEWLGITDLGELRKHVVLCRSCPLRDGARGVVFGEGNPRADIMFIGEGPGRTEDETGRPFVGRAGQLLEYALKSIGLSRGEVFIANIVKCRPPDNRLPLPPEVQACLPHLRAQMRIINPKIVVLLGALSSQTLVNPSIRVTRDRGKWFTKEGVEYLVTFHPAAVLRDEANKKKEFMADMISLKEKRDKIQSGR